MGIQEIDAKRIDEAVTFSWKLCEDEEHCSYPIYASMSEMKDKYSTNELLGYYDDEELRGVLCFYTIPNDNYLQTVGFYVCDEKVSDAFIEFIHDNFNSYSSYIGITKENKIVSQSLLKMGYRCIDDSKMMELNFINYDTIDINKVNKITLANKDSYLKFHNMHFEEGYWNTKRISDNFDEWYITAIIENGNIVAGAFIKDLKNNTSEIFGVYADDEKAYNNLITGLLNDYKLNKQIITKIMCMVECENSCLLNAMEELGFICMRSYCCYISK